MNAPLHGRSFVGGPLLGDNIVRMVFLDEAGTGKPEEEPYLVVAGVIVHADKQWKPIERRLEKLWYDHMPTDVPPGHALHAKELYSGGKVFTRERFDREARWHILDKLVAIPHEFNLPVVIGFVPRSEYPVLADACAQAFMLVAGNVEAYMRVLPDRDEVASIILEDNQEARRHVKDTQSKLQDRDALLHLPAQQRDTYWLTRIMGEPHFEGKSAISLLQIADACAFAAKRKIMKKPDADRFFVQFTHQLVWDQNPKTWRDEDGQSS